MPQDALYAHNGRPFKVVRVSVTYGSQKVEIPLDVGSSIVNVVKHLCNTYFALSQPSNYCLRIVETEELMTDDVCKFKCCTPPGSVH